jgi:hypothetical protein
MAGSDQRATHVERVTCERSDIFLRRSGDACRILLYKIMHCVVYKAASREVWKIEGMRSTVGEMFFLESKSKSAVGLKA